MRDLGLLPGPGDRESVKKRGNCLQHVPPVFSQNERHVRLQVLAGLLDSDGWYSGKDQW